MSARWIVHSRNGFEADHALTIYKGEEEPSHGHQWQVEIRAGCDELNHEGYALDFHEVHRILAEAVAPLDGTDLNHHPKIGRPTPSAERVAEVLAEVIAPDIEAIGGRLLQISVWEGPENRVDLVLSE